MNPAKIFNALFDAVLPRSGRRQRSETHSLTDIPLSSASHDLLNAHILTLFDYREPVIADLIQSLKYDRSFHAARLCADVLADYFREEAASLRTMSTRRILLVPVPLYRKREQERGFNQVETILRLLPAEFLNGQCTSVIPALVRTRSTTQQTRLPRADRIRNVAGAFELAHPSSVENAHVFLIDDVVTTGATLTEAAKPLAPYCASLTLIALARA